MDTAVRHLPIGSMVDRFRIDDVLGGGGFGVTYLAYDSQLDCPVAIKEFMPTDCAVRSPSDSKIIAQVNRDNDYRYGLERFLEEARTLAKFKHPNIVRVSNFVEANNTAYLVMDYEEGEDLGHWLQRKGANGPIAESEIVAVMLPILKGLEKVHQQGLLHRDIKPDNIYMRTEGGPMLIDFGSARYALGSHSKSLSAVLSLGYAPTEQYTSNRKQGAYTDLYAVGATIYHLMSGKKPPDSPDRMTAKVEEEPDPLAPVSELSGDYSHELRELVTWCLQIREKQRPQSVAELITVLQGIKRPADGNGEAPVTLGSTQAQGGSGFTLKTDSSITSPVPVIKLSEEQNAALDQAPEGSSQELPPSNSSRELAIGTMVEHYRIDNVQHLGEVEIIYIATDIRFNFSVRLREFMPLDSCYRVRDSADVQVYPQGQEDFDIGIKEISKEARKLSAINHPNIVSLINTLRCNQTLYLVSKIEAGSSLFEWVLHRDSQRQDEQTVRHIFSSLLNGLHQVHQQDLLHTDISLANIEVHDNGEIALANFGEAQWYYRCISQLETPAYDNRPLELFKDYQKWGPHTDYYSLGVVIYYLMAGEQPMSMARRKEYIKGGKDDPLDVSSDFYGHYSEDLIDALDWCLELKSKDRPGTAQSILDHLEGKYQDELAEANYQVAAEPAVAQQALSPLEMAVGAGERGDSFTPLQINEVVNNSFRVTEYLNRHFFEAEYLAVRQASGEIMWLKEYMPEYCRAYRTEAGSPVQVQPENRDFFSAAIDWYEHDSKIIAADKHPNLQRLKMHFRANGTVYRAWEKVDGQTLAARYQLGFDDELPVSVERKNTLAVFYALLNGLQSLHQRGLVHGNIRPESVLLQKYGEPLLVDYWGARNPFVDPQVFHEEDCYSPLEHFSGLTQLTPASDMYAFGALMFLLLTGEYPIESKERQRCVDEGHGDPLDSAFDLRCSKNYSEKFLQVVDWCLNLELEDRPQSAEAVLHILAEGQAEQTGKPKQQADDSKPGPVGQKPSSKANLQSSNGTVRIKQGEHFGSKKSLSDEPEGDSASSEKMELILGSLIWLAIIAGGLYWWLG